MVEEEQLHVSKKFKKGINTQLQNGWVDSNFKLSVHFDSSKKLFCYQMRNQFSSLFFDYEVIIYRVPICQQKQTQQHSQNFDTYTSIFENVGATLRSSEWKHWNSLERSEWKHWNTFSLYHNQVKNMLIQCESSSWDSSLNVIDDIARAVFENISTEPYPSTAEVTLPCTETLRVNHGWLNHLRSMFITTFAVVLFTKCSNKMDDFYGDKRSLVVIASLFFSMLRREESTQRFKMSKKTFKALFPQLGSKYDRITAINPNWEVGYLNVASAILFLSVCADRDTLLCQRLALGLCFYNKNKQYEETNTPLAKAVCTDHGIVSLGHHIDHCRGVYSELDQSPNVKYVFDSMTIPDTEKNIFLKFAYTILMKSEFKKYIPWKRGKPLTWLCTKSRGISSQGSSQGSSQRYSQRFFSIIVQL